MANTNRSRVLWLDIARGICILCMVTCHCFGWSQRNPMFTFFTGTWFLVFFFFCSGMVFSNKHSFKTFALRQAKKLMIPYVLVVGGILLHRIYTGLWWDLSPMLKAKSFFATLLTSLSADLNGVIPFNTATIGVGPIWFFTCMFMASLIFKAIYPCKYRLPLSIVLAGLSAFSQKYFILPLTLQDAFIGAMFMAIGEAAKPHVYTYVEKVKKMNVLMNLLVAVVLLGIHVLILAVHPCALDLGSNVYTLFTLPGSLSGFVFLLTAAVFFERTQVFDQYLAFCGMESLLIVILHDLDIMFLRNWSARDNSFLIGTLLLYPFVVYIYRRAMAYGKQLLQQYKEKSKA